MGQLFRVAGYAFSISVAMAAHGTGGAWASDAWELLAGGALTPVLNGGEAPPSAESWLGLPGHGHTYRFTNRGTVGLRIQQITPAENHPLELYAQLPVTIAPGASLNLFRMSVHTKQVGVFKGSAVIRWASVAGASVKAGKDFIFRVRSVVAAGPVPVIYRAGAPAALGGDRFELPPVGWGGGEANHSLEIRNLGDRAFTGRFLAPSDVSIPGCVRITPVNQPRAVTAGTPFAAQLLVNRAVPGLCTFKLKVTTDSALYPELTLKGSATILPQTGTAWRPLVPLYLQHYFENAVEFPAARTRPGFFDLFTDATFQYQGPAPSTLQTGKKVHYLHTNIAPRSGYFAEYPFQIAQLDHDETAFLHADDPAQLTLKEEGTCMHLFWKTDARALGTNRFYRIERLIVGPQTPDRREVNWWRPQVWQWQANVMETPGQVSTYVDWLDMNLGSVSAGQEICYRIVTSRIGDATHYDYSLPVCQRLAQSWIQEPYFMIAKVAKGTETSQVITPISYAPGQALDRASTYDFRVIIKEFSANQVSEVTVTNYDHLNEYGNFKPRGAPMPLTLTREGSHVVASGRYTIPMRRMFSDYPHTTEGVFKFSLRWRRANGQFVDVIYPNREGKYWDGGSYEGKGYLTPFPNNRVQDYMWAQMYLQIANPNYQNAFLSELERLRARGYEGVFIDEWRPERTADDRYTMGWQQEAPFYEYPYRTHAEGVVTNPAVNVRLNSTGPVVTDPWIREQDRFGARMREHMGPNWLMFGNTLRGFDAPYTERAVASLDGGMMEGCLYRPPANPGFEESHLQIWRDTLGVIERASSNHRVMVCLQGESLYSWYDPASRFFSLASFLLKWTPGSLVYFGPPIQEPRWNNNTQYFGEDLMHFPEYHLTLGRPLGAATVSPDGQLYKREFEAGWVVVALGAIGLPASTQWSVTFPQPVRRVQIDGVVRTNIQGDSYRYDSVLNPGVLRLDPGAVTHTLQAKQGAIFLKVPQ